MLHRARREREMMRRYPFDELSGEITTDSHSPETVVLGPDGNLYRVSAPSRRERDDDVASSQLNRYNGLTFGEPGENLERDDEEVFSSEYCANPDKDDSAGYNSASSQEWHDWQDIDDGSRMKYPAARKSALPAQKQVPRREIVEDVPDEEDEELRDMHSVWRNRIPSPGQWMEPVETFREK